MGDSAAVVTPQAAVANVRHQRAALDARPLVMEAVWLWAVRMMQVGMTSAAGAFHVVGSGAGLVSAEVVENGRRRSNNKSVHQPVDEKNRAVPAARLNLPVASCLVNGAGPFPATGTGAKAGVQSVKKRCARAAWAAWPGFREVSSHRGL